LPASAAVVGAGVAGLAAARALRDEGLAVTVYEQFAVGTPLGASSGRTRIYRTSYKKPAYVRLARRAIEEWQRLDPALLVRNGMLEYGDGVERNAAALAECGEDHEVLDRRHAERLFPEARFPEGPIVHTADAGALLADDALRRLAAGLDIREGVRIDDPGSLEADVVVLCAGAWLSRLVPLPLRPQLEQVSYHAGAPDTRPSVIDHGRDGGPVFYGLVAPGLGYKIGQDNAATGPFDPDARERPVEREGLERAAAFVERTLPGLSPQAHHAESCIYTMSPDTDFVIDRLDGIAVCGGDSGHAFKFGPLLGRLVVDVAFDRPLDPDAEMFRAARLDAAVPAGRPPAPSEI
jgi:sarcosine oxidase